MDWRGTKSRKSNLAHLKNTCESSPSCLEVKVLIRNASSKTMLARSCLPSLNKPLSGIGAYYMRPSFEIPSCKWPMIYKKPTRQINLTTVVFILLQPGTHMASKEYPVTKVSHDVKSYGLASHGHLSTPKLLFATAPKDLFVPWCSDQICGERKR